MTSQTPPTTPLPPTAEPPAGPPPADPPYGSSAGSWSEGPSIPGRAPLRRSREDRVIGGVCGGLAAHTGIDALLFRVGAIALTFAGGSGILIYLLLWVLMPSKPGDQGPRTRRKLRIGLVVVAVLALLGVIAAAIGALVFGGRDRAGDLGDQDLRPQSAESVESRYSTSVGDIDLDLSAIDVSSLNSPIRTQLSSNAGDIDVQVPASADVEVRVENRMGDVELFGEGGDGGPFAGSNSASGSGLFEGSGSGSWTGDGEPEIILVIDSGLGDVDVDRG